MATYQSERVRLTVTGIRAYDDRLDCDFIRVTEIGLTDDAGENIGVFEKVSPVGENYRAVQYLERLLGADLVSIEKLPVEEDTDGGGEDHATDEVEAREGEVPEDGASPEEEEPVLEAGDDPESGETRSLPEGEDDDSAETALKEEDDDARSVW